MKAYFSILLLFGAACLSYGSSHVVSSDSVVKNRADTIKIGKTDRNSHYYKGYKPLTDAELEFLLKDAHNEQVDNYLTESKQTKANSGILWGIWAFALVVGTIIFLAAIASIFGSVFSGTSGGSGGGSSFGLFFGILAGISLYVLPVFAITTKAKSRRLKRKAVERYNEIVKSGK